jgi:maleylacetoacetate isomerase
VIGIGVAPCHLGIVAILFSFVRKHKPFRLGPSGRPARHREASVYADPGPIRKATAPMPRQPRFELFAYWRTSATYRVRVALALKGLAAHETIVDIDKGENRSPAFLGINPLGAIPAMIDREGDDAVITQSLAILEYLEEVAPRPALLPPDPSGRARVRSIAAMLVADTHPLITPRVRTYLTEVGGFDQAAWRAWQTQWFSTGLQALEARLAAEAETGTFCHRDTVTIADICLASIIVVMRVFGITVPGIPTVERIMAACEANEAFVRADPWRQVGAPPQNAPS